MVADNEELENMDAVEIRARRISAKDVLTPTRSEHFILQVPDGTTKFSGRDHEFREPTLRRELPEGSEALSGELQGEPEGPQQTESKDDAEARSSGRFILTSSIVITLNLEFNSMCRKEKIAYSTEIH